MAHALNWFDLPARDFARARTFYESILGVELQVSDMPGMQIATFPADWQKGEVAGGIIAGEGMTPSAEGTTVYLNGDPDLQVVLDRVEAAGGTILMPKTAIPMEGAGHSALFLDTEGNKVGLHSTR